MRIFAESHFLELVKMVMNYLHRSGGLAVSGLVTDSVLDFSFGAGSQTANTPILLIAFNFLAHLSHQSHPK